MERKEEEARPHTRTAPQPAEPTIAQTTIAIGQRFPTVETIAMAKNSHIDVNTSGKAGAQIPQLPLGYDSSPWGR
jgi:hypothetical protein